MASAVKPPIGTFSEQVRKIDYWGVLSVSAAVILLLIPVSGGVSYFAWDSPMAISMLVIGSLLFVLFVVIALRTARLPLMPMKMFKSHVITVLMVQSFLLCAAYRVSLYYLPLFLQNARGYSVIECTCRTGSGKARSSGANSRGSSVPASVWCCCHYAWTTRTTRTI